MIAALALAVAAALAAPTPAAAAPDPDAARIAWVRAHAIPFATPDAGSGFADLEPLKKVVGGARIVALGEATHGTSEFFRMKHRLTEFLASNMGFTIFAIEANMPEAYRVNDFVLTGRGDPRALLRGMYFWTWDTQEVLDMILWMREFNRSGHGRIQFTGFDMQTPDSAMAIVRRFVAASEPGDLATVDATFRRIRQATPTPDAFGTATATFPIAIARGHRIRYTGCIRTEKVDEGFAGLWWRVDGDSGVMAFDNMRDRGPRGTTGWTRGEITIDVPARAKHINFGVLMVGPGTSWFDSLGVTIDGVPYRNDALFDFDFEGPSARGFPVFGNGYTGELDNKVACSGRQSLKIRLRGLTRRDVGWPEALQAADELVRHLEARRAIAIRWRPAAEVDWAIQNARIVHQQAQMMSGSVSRDRSMADNAIWILDHAPPGSKMVIWAHNGHVAHDPRSMGEYLAQKYGSDLLVLGFAFHEGRYNAIRNGRLEANEAKPSEPGSVEWVLHSTGIPRFILDLRQARAGSPMGKWFAEEHPFRSIGALAIDDPFDPTSVSRQFDGLIFFDQTHPSQLLERTAGAP